MLDLTSDLCRRVEASIHWETRLANLFFGLRVAVTSVPDGFGQVVMGIFSLLGITGMEPLENPPKNLRQLDNRHVPPAYGRQFGRKAIAWGVKRLKDNEQAQDFLVMFMGELHNKAKLGQLKSIEGKDMDSAQKFVFRLMHNFLQDQYRKENRRRTRYDTGDEVDVSDMVLPDTGVRDLSQDDMTHLDKALGNIANQIQRQWPDSGITKEDLNLYVNYLSDGLSDEQIIRQKMLPFLKDRATFSPAAWTKYKQFIREQLTDELKTAGLMVRYLDEEAPVVEASEVTRNLTASLVEKTANDAQLIFKELSDAYKAGEKDEGGSTEELEAAADALVTYVKTVAVKARRNKLGRPIGVFRKLSTLSWNLAYAMGQQPEDK